MKEVSQKVATFFLLFMLFLLLMEKLWILFLLASGRKVELKEDNRTILNVEIVLVSFLAFFTLVMMGLTIIDANK